MLSMRGESLFISLTSAEKVAFWVKDFDRPTSARFNNSRGWCVFGSTRFPKESASDIEKNLSVCIQAHSHHLRRIGFVPPRLYKLESHNLQLFVFNARRLDNRSSLDSRALPTKEKSWYFPRIHEHSRATGRLPKEDRAKFIFSFELTRTCIHISYTAHEQETLISPASEILWTSFSSFWNIFLKQSASRLQGRRCGENQK